MIDKQKYRYSVKETGHVINYGNKWIIQVTTPYNGVYSEMSYSKNTFQLSICAGVELYLHVSDIQVRNHLSRTGQLLLLCGLFSKALVNFYTG